MTSASVAYEAGVSWLPGVTVPADWRRKRVKHVLSDLRAGDGITAESIETAGEYPVYGGNGVRGYTTAYTHAGNFLLIGRQGALCGNVHLASGKFWASEHAMVGAPAAGVDPRWLVYTLRTMNLGQYSVTAAQPGIGVAQVMALDLYVPEPAEQRAIADFLDEQSSRIDKLIDKQSRLITTLRERRQAVTADLLTQGAPGRHALQHTGHLWLGPIPLDWRHVPLWSLYQRIKDTGHPDEPMVSVFRDHGVVLKESLGNYNKTAENRDIYQLVHPGWLLTNRMKAWQGSVGISGVRGITSGHYICFAPRHAEDHDYLNLLFRSSRYIAAYRLLSRGVRPGQIEIDNDEYRVLPVVLPPLDEQRELVQHVCEQTSQIDALISKTERHITLANERRAALMTAATTGQIDVRTAGRATQGVA